MFIVGNHHRINLSSTEDVLEEQVDVVTGQQLEVDSSTVFSLITKENTPW